MSEARPPARPEDNPPARNDRDFTIHVEIGADVVRPAAVTRTRLPRGFAPQPPRITGGNWLNSPERSGEILAAFYDREGRLLSVAAQGSKNRFCAQLRVSREQLGFRGQSFHPPVDNRAFDLRTPEDTAYFGFFRTQILARPARESGLKSTSTILRGVGPDQKPRALQISVLAMWRFPDPVLQLELPAAGFEWPIPGVAPLIDPVWIQKALERMPGSVLEVSDPGEGGPVEVLHAPGSAVEAPFNILITGDGFNEESYWGATGMELYARMAEMLKKAILDREPFKSLKDRIRIVSVPKVSPESGITDCPEDGVIRNTAYRCEGHWNDSPCEEHRFHIGTPKPALIHQAAGPGLPECQVGLFIVVVNCWRSQSHLSEWIYSAGSLELFSGNADPKNRIVYVTVGALMGAPLWHRESWNYKHQKNPQTFAWLALHESGHAMANLTDEDIRCWPLDVPPDSHPNMVYIPDPGEMPKIPWVELATAAEYGGGGFTEVRTTPPDQNCGSDPEDCGGDLCYCAHNREVEDLATAEELLASSKLGLYWGCMYFEPAPEPTCEEVGATCDRFSDEGSRNFYRGQPICMMRTMGVDFCRVCEHALRQRILNPEYGIWW